METKFTPGPWVIQNKNIHSLQFQEPLDDRNLIASVKNENPESLRNLNLIAAAPDLYRALKNMIREWIEIIGDEEENKTPADTLEKAKKILAKAEGRIDL